MNLWESKRIVLLIAAVLGVAAATGIAADDKSEFVGPPGVSEVVRLWPGDAPATRPVDGDDQITVRGTINGVSVFSIIPGATPSMSVYLPANSAKPTAAIVICPGGAYRFAQASSEGHDVARALTQKGIAAFVLRYRLPDGKTPAPGQLPWPQQDGMRAVQLVRAGAGHWNIDPAKVGIMGFSAGGHLAATVATMYDEANSFHAKAQDDAASKLSARPDFAVLAYAVITMKQHTHIVSRNNLLGQQPSDEVESRFSADEHVTAKTPPLFITVAYDDKLVPVSNSESINAAAAKAGIPHQLLAFRRSEHGFGLGRGQSTGWLNTAVSWLATQHLIDASK